MTPEDQPAPAPVARTRLMQEVAEQMDAIESDFGDDFAIGRVVTIVEVYRPEGVGLRVRSQHFPWVTIGILETAKRQLEAQTIGGEPPPAGD